MYRAMSSLYMGPDPGLDPPDMFKLVQLGPNSDRTPPDTFSRYVLYVHYETQTVGRWAVGIQLKCLLVTNIFIT